MTTATLEKPKTATITLADVLTVDPDRKFTAAEMANVSGIPEPTCYLAVDRDSFFARRWGTGVHVSVKGEQWLAWVKAKGIPHEVTESGKRFYHAKRIEAQQAEKKGNVVDDAFRIKAADEQAAKTAAANRILNLWRVYVSVLDRAIRPEPEDARRLANCVDELKLDYQRVRRDMEIRRRSRELQLASNTACDEFKALSQERPEFFGTNEQGKRRFLNVNEIQAG